MGGSAGSPEPSSIVLNIGDPSYPSASGDGMGNRRPSADDILLRILVYGLLADRVVIPSRHLLSGGPVWEAVRSAPVLLREGVVAPQLRSGYASLGSLVEARSLEHEALQRARFLDTHAALTHMFPVDEVVSDYQRTLVEDCRPDGALSRLLPGGRRGGSRALLDDIAAAYEQTNGFYNHMTGLMRGLPSRQRSIALRWAAARYYSVPGRHDPSAVLRDVPPSASVLLQRAGVVVGPDFRSVESSELVNELTAPLKVPMLHSRDSRVVDQLISGVLALRRDLPNARERFEAVTGSARSHGEDVVQAVDDEFRRQQQAIGRRFPSTATEVIVTVALNVAGLGAGLSGGPDGAILGVTAGAGLGLGWNHLAGVLARRHAQRTAPWAVLESKVRSLSHGSA